MTRDTVKRIVEDWFDEHEDSSDAGYSVVTHADLGFLVDDIIGWLEAEKT